MAWNETTQEQYRRQTDRNEMGLISMTEILRPDTVPRPAPATRRHVVQEHSRTNRDDPRGRCCGSLGSQFKETSRLLPLHPGGRSECRRAKLR